MVSDGLQGPCPSRCASNRLVSSGCQNGLMSPVRKKAKCKEGVIMLHSGWGCIKGRNGAECYHSFAGRRKNGYSSLGSLIWPFRTASWTNCRADSGGIWVILSFQSPGRSGGGRNRLSHRWAFTRAASYEPMLSKGLSFRRKYSISAFVRAFTADIPLLYSSKNRVSTCFRLFILFIPIPSYFQVPNSI